MSPAARIKYENLFAMFLISPSISCSWVFRACFSIENHMIKVGSQW